MSRSTRVLLALLVGGFAVLVLGAGGLALAAARAGTVAVELHDAGTDVSLAVPAALVHLAIVVAPAHAIHEALEEAGPYVPAIAAAWPQLERGPDFTLVEVSGRGTHVQVAKRGSRLVVSALEDGTRIEVGVPLGTVRTLLRKLA